MPAHMPLAIATFQSPLHQCSTHHQLHVVETAAVVAVQSHQQNQSSFAADWIGTDLQTRRVKFKTTVGLLHRTQERENETFLESCRLQDV